MINFIFGNQGCGKTSYILEMLKRDAQKNMPSILIVPEQEAVIAERKTLEALPPNAQLTLEVLNFSRLYNRVCREYGGLCYSYITKPMKHIIMWRTLREISPMLTEYAENAISDSAFVSTMLATVSELKYSCITTQQLEDAAKECIEKFPLLASKLKDISMIYGAFDILVNEKYSDSADDLSKLCDILDEHDFFKGKNVYFDSFSSFTGIEHRVVEKIFKSADNVTVSIPLPSPKYSDISTLSIEESLKTLKKNANKWGGYKSIVLDTKRIHFAPELTYLSENIWNLEKDLSSDLPSCNDSIVMEICDNMYAETEAAASHIHSLVQSGARYRDISVIMRDASKYKGIIEPAFNKADIPFFFSEKTDICTLAPIKFILTAIRIHQFGWKKNDVISHIKTGLFDFDIRECDLFEEYINTWNISGNRFTDNDWSMNPDGYTGRITDRGKFILSSANSVRRQLCKTLEEFFVLLDISDKLPDMCRAVYTFIEKSKLRDKTLELANRENSFGNKKSASELAASYDIILKSLADIGQTLTDTTCSIDDFYTILKTVFEQTEIGTIPTSVDEVTVGSASLLRSSSPKYVFVLGLCEGEFPADINDNGIFKNTDKNLLNECGIVLGGDDEIHFSDELMFVKNTFSTPLIKLYLFTYLSDMKGTVKTPSLPFRRTEKMFSDLTPHRFCGNDLDYLSGTPRSAASHLRNITKDADRKAATLAVSEYIPSALELSVASSSTDNCRVSPEIVKDLIGDCIYISPSSLEKYIKCPFSYYAGYILSLRETKKVVFGANNIGDFVHYVMEHIIHFALPSDNENKSIPTDEEIVQKINEIVDDYIKLISPDNSVLTKRMQHLYKKLHKLSTLVAHSVLKEFSDSDFIPAFFEFHIDGKDGNPQPLTIPLSNGCKLVLKGYIDRVDIWKHDNQVHVRIVDYKTGSKQFKLSDLDMGLNTQMLLYLFAVCRNPGTTFNTKYITDNIEICPAGVMYLSSNFPKIELNDFSETDDQIFDMASHKLTRSGIIINDEQVINAMSHSSSTELLLGISKKDGKFVGKSLISSDNFLNLYDSISKTLIQIGENIYDGIADSSPIEGEDPCKYCKVYPICRKNNFEKKEREK